MRVTIDRALIFTLSGWLLALSFWAGVTWSEQKATASAVTDLRTEGFFHRRIILDRLTNIDQRLSRIEGQLGLPD